MPRAFLPGPLRGYLLGSAAFLLWIVWLILVIAEVVPLVRRHITMWPWLIAYFLCVAPVLLLAVFVVTRLRARA